MDQSQFLFSFQPYSSSIKFYVVESISIRKRTRSTDQAQPTPSNIFVKGSKM